MADVVVNEPVQVDSSSISEVEYQESERLLRVVFVRSGREYNYRNVPANVYRAFLDATSKGRFFVENIRDRYSF